MKSIIVLFVCLLPTFALQAQNTDHSPFGGGQEGREKILQMRLTHVKDNLGLTEAENQAFLPVYEKNLRQEEALRQKLRSLMKGMKQNYAQMSDAELEKNFAEEMQLEQQMLDVRKANLKTYLKLIPVKKVVELKIVERSFNKMLMEKLREEKPDGDGPPGER